MINLRRELVEELKGVWMVECIMMVRGGGRRVWSDMIFMKGVKLVLDEMKRKVFLLLGMLELIV